jgi:hypothetical protein
LPDRYFQKLLHHKSLLFLVKKGKKQKRVTRGVSHSGLAIYIKKYLKAKEELWKLKYFVMHKYKSSKNPPRKTKILQDIKTL